MRTGSRIALGLVLLAGAAGCRGTGGGAEGPRGLRVTPAAARAGEVVTVAADAERFDADAPPRVTVGGVPATVTAVLDDGRARVLVPSVGEGEAIVSASVDGELVGGGVLRVLAPSGTRVVLQLDAGGLRVLDTLPATVDGRRGSERRDARLSFDLVTPQGGLVYTASVPHPVRGRTEVFEPPREGGRAGRGVRAPKDVVFAVEVPRMPEATLLRVFEVDAGVDVGTKEGRAGRRLLGEVRLEGSER